MVIDIKIDINQVFTRGFQKIVGYDMFYLTIVTFFLYVFELVFTIIK